MKQGKYSIYHILFKHRKIFQDAISLKTMNHDTMYNTIWTIIPSSCLQNVSCGREGGEGEGSVSSGSMIENFQQKKSTPIGAVRSVPTLFVGKASKRFSRRLVLRLAL